VAPRLRVRERAQRAPAHLGPPHPIRPGISALRALLPAVSCACGCAAVVAFRSHTQCSQDPEGYANLEKNWDHIKKHGYGGNPFVEAVVACMVDGGAGRTAFAHRVAMYLVRRMAGLVRPRA
jgi:hypothetical protein